MCGLNSITKAALSGTNMYRGQMRMKQFFELTVYVLKLFGYFESEKGPKFGNFMEKLAEFLVQKGHLVVWDTLLPNKWSTVNERMKLYQHTHELYFLSKYTNVIRRLTLYLQSPKLL